MKKGMKKLLSLLLTIVLSTAVTTVTPVVKADTTAADTVGVQYKGHVQNIGWQSLVSDGQEAGTDGQSLRVEALKIKLVNAPAGASIKYQAHVQNAGWQNWVSDGQEAGTDGQGLRVEAVKIILENMPGYSVQYQAHVQNAGWKDWVSDGQESGTEGQSLRVEAIRIRIVKISDNSTIGVQYQGHVQNTGWQNQVSNGQISGTEGLSYRVEALKINLVNAPAGASIKYSAHVQNVGWQNEASNGQEAGTDGQGLRIEAVKITLENMPGYSVQYQAHIQNIGWQPWVSDGQEAGTDGKSLRIEAIRIRIVYNKKGYVYNAEPQIDLNVRSSPDLNGSIIGHLYNYEKVEILDTIVDNSNNVWGKITYNNIDSYISDAYVQPYTSPPDSVVNMAVNTTKQFEVGTSDQIAGNFDGQGLSLGYLQWCIGQDSLQMLLNRMDRQYNSEMKSIFGTNYDAVHNMILDTPANQLKWARSINDFTNTIISPWYSQLVSLSKNQDFIKIEKDAEVYSVKQAMRICDKYNLKTERGFALAFDIVVQNGSISSAATAIIDTAVQQDPGMTEKDILTVIANAVANSSAYNTEVIRSRELAIVNGQGDANWR